MMRNGILWETKKHTPPPFLLFGRSLLIHEYGLSEVNNESGIFEFNQVSHMAIMSKFKLFK